MAPNGGTSVPVEPCLNCTHDYCSCRERVAVAELDRVVDSCIVALSEYDTETLLRVADTSKQRNPKGWLPKMVREYVDVWR